MSSLAAVLASPASGVSEAVTGYPIGRGDGVNSVFMVPSEITAVSALYRTDWQGTVELSASVRTNYLINSVWDGGGAAPTNWVQDFGTGTSTPVVSTYGSDDGASAYLQTATSQRPYFIQKYTASANTTYCASVLIESVSADLPLAISQVMANSGAPPSGECTYPVCPANPSGGPLGGLVPGELKMIYNIGATGGVLIPRFGLGTSSAVSATLKMSRPQFEVGSVRTSYIPTTTAPVSLTDYALSGLTLTLAEAPARAAELTVDGTGVGIPMLRIA